MYATNIATIVISAVIWIKIYAKGKTIVNIKYWKYSLKLSAPLIGYAFAAQILSVSDRMMISKMVGNDAVGIYSTLYTVCINLHWDDCRNKNCVSGFEKNER